MRSTGRRRSGTLRHRRIASTFGSLTYKWALLPRRGGAIFSGHWLRGFARVEPAWRPGITRCNANTSALFL
jgi:hypothetical protein